MSDTDRNETAAGRVSRLKWIFLAAAAAALVLSVFSITYIPSCEVRGNHYLEADYIEEALFGGDIGERYFYALLAEQLQGHKPIGGVASYRIVFHRNFTVSIDVTEEEPAAVIAWRGMLYPIDQNGFVMARLSQAPEGLTVIEGAELERIPLYSTVEPKNIEVSRIMMLLRQIRKFGISAQKLVYAANGTVVLTTGSMQVKLGSSVHMEEKIGTLHDILQESILDGIKGTLNLEDCGESGTQKNYIFELEEELET